MNTPAMIGDPGDHGGRPGQPLMAADQPRQPQTQMIGTEVVDGSDQVHPPVQGLALPGQGAASANQRAQPLTECAVESLDVSGVDHASGLRLLEEGFDRLGGALNNSSHDGGDLLVHVLVDRLSDADIVPRSESGSSTLAAGDGVAKDIAHGTDRGAQSIGTEQAGPPQGRRTGANLFHQRRDQMKIPVCRNHTAQPRLMTRPTSVPC